MKKLNSKELKMINGGFTPPSIAQIGGDITEFLNSAWNKMEDFGRNVGCLYKRYFMCN